MGSRVDSDSELLVPFPLWPGPRCLQCPYGAGDACPWSLGCCCLAIPVEQVQFVADWVISACGQKAVPAGFVAAGRYDSAWSFPGSLADSLESGCLEEWRAQLEGPWRQTSACGSHCC